MSAQIVCHNLVKVYKSARVEVVALQGLDLSVDAGELVAVVGASGSGKSTLQNILAGLDAPTAGRAVVAGHDLTRLDARGRRDYRLRVVGFVAQETRANLVDYLSAAENVALPLLLARARPRERLRRVEEALELVGMGDHARTRAEHLSGGEQQRLAVAVALANSPAVLLADEPTAELDVESSRELFTALRAVAQTGVTVVVTTHDPLVTASVERTIAIRDGRTSTEVVRSGEGAGGEEFVLLDAAGRLQLPAEYVEALGLERRVRVRLTDGRIELRPEEPR